MMLRNGQTTGLQSESLMKLIHLLERTTTPLMLLPLQRKGVDKKSPYYIYKVNNGASNNTSDYVFKTSSVMAQIATDMDIDGPQNILQKENAYFDTTFCRVYGFSSFGLWFYHP